MASIKGRYVRRIDAIGRPYYVPREGGQRVRAILWKEERARIRTQVERVRKEGEKIAELREVPPTAGPGEAPFPPEVMGLPVDERGVPRRDVWRDEDGVEWEVPYAIEGEDDTP